MLDRERYIWKAKHQRGLTDEQIQYFLARDSRYDLVRIAVPRWIGTPMPPSIF